EERAIMQKRLVQQMADLLEQGNFTRVDPANVHFILTKDSAYGLDLEVDLDAFEEILIYYRGATTISEHRRDVRKAYMRWREVKIPVFQRMLLLFKLKPFDVRVREVMADRKIDKKDAEKFVRHLRGLLPVTVTSDYVYIKLFKNMPRSDVEMLLYSVLAKERVNIANLRHVDEAIEQYLATTFGIDVDFDVDDALERLKEEGIVTELPDGTLETLPPHEAALHIDKLWDACL